MLSKAHSWNPELPTVKEGKVLDDKSRSMPLPFQDGANVGRAMSLPEGAHGDYGEHQNQDDEDLEDVDIDSEIPMRIGGDFEDVDLEDVDREDWSDMPMRHCVDFEDVDLKDRSEGLEVGVLQKRKPHRRDLPVESEDKDKEELILLKHSRPVKVGGPGQDCHMVRIVRATLLQSFGVKIGTIESRGGQPATCVAAEDYPHLRVMKLDRLVSVNNVQLNKETDVTRALQNALSITLVFQRSGSPLLQGPQPWVKECCVPMAKVNRSLLSVTRATIVNRKRGEFKLCLKRTSFQQSFGLPCEAVLSESGSLTIIISKNMPHLALRKKDRLSVINGEKPRCRAEYSRIKNSSLSLSLVFRRDPSQLHDFVHHIQDIGEDVSEVDVQQRRTCGPCNMLGPDVAVHKSDSMGGAKNMKSPKALSWFLGHFTGSSGFSRVWPCKPPDSEVKEVASESSNIEELFSIFEGTQQKGATKTVQRAPKTAQSSRRNGKAVQVDSPNLLGMQVDSPNLLGMSEPGGWQL